MTKKFQVGRTYYDRSLCECIFYFFITGRTAKTVTFDHQGEISRRGVSVCDGVEQFKPFGTRSMCAVVSADRECVSLIDLDRTAALRRCLPIQIAQGDG